MAEAALLVGHVLQKLGGFLMKEELQIQTEARRSIKSVRDQLEMVQALLPEVQDNPIMDEFSSKLQEVSYDIEDLVDDFMFQNRPEKASKKFLAQLKNNRRIVRRLHKVKPRLEEVSRNMYKVADGDVPHGTATLRAVSSRSPAFDADASSLVGVDGPREELAKLLIEEEPESASRLKVISIVGFGGLGKTTLANEVYSTTKEYFGCRAWVPVSRNPNMMNILMGILRQVEDPHITRADGEGDERYLIGKIRESLQNKRYLIVIDDIWSTETWDIIKSALPLNHSGSRVITTTRKKSVAESCCSHWNDYVYNLKPLSEMDSKELFLEESLAPRTVVLHIWKMFHTKS